MTSNTSRSNPKQQQSPWLNNYLNTSVLKKGSIKNYNPNLSYSHQVASKAQTAATTLINDETLPTNHNLTVNQSTAFKHDKSQDSGLSTVSDQVARLSCYTTMVDNEGGVLSTDYLTTGDKQFLMCKYI